MTYPSGFNIRHARREIGFIGTGSAYPINKGYIDTEIVEDGYFPSEKNESWLKIGTALPPIFERKGELDDLFSDNVRLVVIEPELIAVEALRLDSWHNRASRPFDERRINAMLFAGYVVVGNASVPVAGVHAFGEKNQGLIVPTHSNKHSKYALSQLSLIAAVGRGQED